jgi:hypothetical protein
LSSAAPQLMISSRSNGSTTGNARMRSAHTKIVAPLTTKRHGCELWLDGASTA